MFVVHQHTVKRVTGNRSDSVNRTSVLNKDVHITMRQELSTSCRQLPLDVGAACPVAACGGGNGVVSQELDAASFAGGLGCCL